MPVLPFYQFELKDKLNSKPQCFDSFNFLFLLQGTGTIRCRNQLIHLKPHDFTFFNMYEIHQFLTFSPDARVLSVLIHKSYIQSAVPELTDMTLNTHTVTPESEPERYEFFCQEFGKFIYYHTVHSPGAQLHALSHLGNLLSYILNQLSTSSASALHGTQTRDDRLFHALTYITEHYTKDLSLPEVAAQIGLHPQYFSKYFREHMGLTLTEYIN